MQELINKTAYIISGLNLIIPVIKKKIKSVKSFYLHNIYAPLSELERGKTEKNKIFWKKLQGNKKEIILIPSAETVTSYLAICFHGVNADIALALSRTEMKNEIRADLCLE